MIILSGMDSISRIHANSKKSQTTKFHNSGFTAQINKMFMESKINCLVCVYDERKRNKERKFK